MLRTQKTTRDTIEKDTGLATMERLVGTNRVSPPLGLRQKADMTKPRAGPGACQVSVRADIHSQGGDFSAVSRWIDDCPTDIDDASLGDGG